MALALMLTQTAAADNIKDNYHTFFIDIYPTLNLNDFVFLLGNRICRSLKAKDKQLMELFVKVVKSIQFTIGFDVMMTF